MCEPREDLMPSYESDRVAELIGIVAEVLSEDAMYTLQPRDAEKLRVKFHEVIDRITEDLW